MITPAEFEQRMKELREDIEDIEERHIKADELLCETLKSLGYDAGVKLFERTRKWYA